jgi:hypothetical protein
VFVDGSEEERVRQNENLRPRQPMRLSPLQQQLQWLATFMDANIKPNDTVIIIPKDNVKRMNNASFLMLNNIAYELNESLGLDLSKNFLLDEAIIDFALNETKTGKNDPLICLENGDLMVITDNLTNATKSVHYVTKGLNIDPSEFDEYAALLSDNCESRADDSEAKQEEISNGVDSPIDNSVNSIRKEALNSSLDMEAWMQWGNEIKWSNVRQGSDIYEQLQKRSAETILSQTDSNINAGETKKTVVRGKR